MVESLMPGAASFALGALFLVLALIGLRHAQQRGMARALTLLCAALAAYQVAEGMADVTGSAAWDRLEFAIAPLIAVATLDFLSSVLRSRRRIDRFRPLVVGYFGILAVATLSGVVDPTGSDPGPQIYVIAMLGVILPGGGWLLWSLLSQALQDRGRDRLRGQLMVSGCFIGVVGAASDLVAIAGLDVPKLSRPALALAAVIFAFLAFQRRMISTDRLVTMNVVAIAIVAVAVLGVIFSALGAEVGPLVLATLLMGIFLAVGLRPAMAYVSGQQARRDYMATLGRFTAQMAHDLRNPIASIQGVSRFLIDERRAGRSVDDFVEEFEALFNESRHMQRIVETYQRMGRLELDPREYDLREIAAGVARSVRRWNSTSPIELVLEVDEVPLMAEVDEPLVRSALENLVRNAWEALDHRGGEVRLSVSGGLADGKIELGVQDDGPGMTADVREMAAEDFFSTKRDGSGMGLSLARRVAEAHGGHLELDSEPGRGVRAAMLLPGVAPGLRSDKILRPGVIRTVSEPREP